MAGLLSSTSDVAKLIYLGDSGVGKTGSKAALVACGYKLRQVDTDNGAKILRSMLTDEEHFPYASWMKKTGLDPTEPGRISIMSIDVPIETQARDVKRKGGTIQYDVIAPANSRSWNDVVKLLNDGWIDEDWGNLGKVTDWGNDTVLDFDTLATLSEFAKYWNQDMNSRLGALEDDHGRDTGAAQELIRRLMLKVTSPAVKCNVIATTHIRKVDVNRGVALSVGQLLRDQKPTDPRGFPDTIGNALSTVLGKRWNDQLIAYREGSGRFATRRISSVPVENTDAKSSVYLEDSYDIETGLAEIFAALLYQPYPHEFVEHCRAFHAKQSPSNSPANGAQKSPYGGF